MTSRGRPEGTFPKPFFSHLYLRLGESISSSFPPGLPSNQTDLRVLIIHHLEPKLRSKTLSVRSRGSSNVDINSLPKGDLDTTGFVIGVRCIPISSHVYLTNFNLFESLGQGVRTM